MKILNKGPAYPFRGGIVQFSTQLAHELRHKNEIKFFSFEHQYPKILFPGKDQFSQTEKPDFTIISKLTPYNPFTWIPTIKSINDWKPDILIVSYWIPFFALSFGFILRHLNKKTKLYYIVHNIDFHEKWIFAKSLTKYAFKKADLLVTLSESVYNDAIKLFPKKKTIHGFHPVYNCYNFNKFTKVSAKSELKLTGKKVILFFGYIKQYKGLELLIRSLPNIINKIENAHLLIVGEVYGDAKKYHNAIEENELGNRVTFVDRFVKDKEIELYFKAADVLALPYIQATQSGVVQIAYDMELGAVATPVGSLAELVLDNKTGIMATDVSKEAFADAIVRYFELDQEELIRNIKEESKKYSWEVLAKLILKSV
ncbi:MAG: glycosyltransferase family 4 protein [Candidatus Delongbacteria bacterium]|nr:glycosyltransferase family 4 protein [Candidatus Delongbacteria bacterium]